MKTIQASLPHIVLEPEARASGTLPTLIMVHGRGADEEDLPGLAPMLDPRFLILSVRAPFPFPYGGYTWYEVGEVGSPDPGMFRESHELFVRFVEEIRAGYPVDPSRLFLFGFSMGTVMSYALSLTRPDLVRGVSANSGYVPEGTHLSFRWDGLRDTGFFIAHGTHDPVISVDFGRRARDLFLASNADMTYREYPMGHQISDESIRDVSAWLRSLVDAAPPPHP